MIHKLAFATGIFCLIFSMIPALIYGILNTGVGAMALGGLLLVFLPKYWEKIAAIKHMRGIVIFLAAIGCCYIIIISALMINRAYYRKPPEKGKVAVIVLGSGIIDDKPSLMLSRRLNGAARYLMENPDAYCIVTGGQGPDEIMPESVVMGNYLVQLGIPPERIITEDKSTNTRENLTFAYELTSDRDIPAVVATDSFHQLRAQMYAKNAGFDEVYGISSLTPWGLLPSYWVRDMLGIAVAWLITK